MNKFLFLLITLFMTISVEVVAQQNDSSTNTEIDEGGMNIYNHSRIIRPRGKNTSQKMTYYVANGNIYISFKEMEGMAFVSLYENGVDEISSVFISTANQIELPIPLVGGSIQISILTSLGNEYEVWID